MFVPFYHQPVLADIVADFLITDPKGIYLDCTTGGGGHSEKILNKLKTEATLICLDADPGAIQYADSRLKKYPNKILRQLFFDQLEVVLIEQGVEGVNGFLFDLGISSRQVEDGARGFSYQADGPLDMRFNPEQELNAEIVVNKYPEERLGNVFRNYGEERYWRRISKKIVNSRKQKPIKSNRQLKEIILSVAGAKMGTKSLARIFQAVRIEVNDELARLKTALSIAFKHLLNKGRIVVVSYHSLEDRIVKEYFRYWERDCTCPPDFVTCVCNKKSEARILTRKPLQPSESEIGENPRARSAKLRAIEKIILEES